MNCDACEYFSSDLRSGHLMRPAEGCPEDGEGLFEVIADRFMSNELMVFM